MVRTTTNVKAKPGTVSTGGLGYQMSKAGKMGTFRTEGAYNRSIPNAMEKKYFDTSIINSADITGGLILDSANKIPQGTTDKTRIGNKITITNVNLHAYANLDSLNGIQVQNSHLRVILYVDHQANGATAAVTDILTTASIDSFRNMNQVDRFTILKEINVDLNCYSQSATTSADGATRYTINKKCKIPVHYSSITGAITEIRSNNVGILFIGSTSHLNAAFKGTVRVKYMDL